MAQDYNSQLDAFVLYHKVNESNPLLGGPALPALGHAVSGSIGAACSNLLTYPLDLIITRLQIQRQLRKDSATPHSEEYKSVQDAAYRIYSKEGGLPGFYVGVVQDTSKTIAGSFLFFLAYNFLRQSRLRSKQSSSKNLPVLDELGVGFLAGAFSKFLTTPIANVVTRKQTLSMLSARSRNISSTTPATTRSIAQQIHSEKGLLGFWSGYSASLILTLNPSLTFFLYETFKRAFLPREQRSKPSPQATFLLAAISKAIASSITYPFSLAKARAQASSKVVDNNDLEIKGSIQEASGGQTSGTKSGRKTARNTVLSTILHIARTDGTPALYEGLSGEVLKGFLSHGITMVVKENVHKLIIQLYYTILKLLKKYPEPHKMVEMAKSQVQDSLGSLQKGAEATSIKVQGAAKDFSHEASEAYKTTVTNAKSAGSSMQSRTAANAASIKETAGSVHSGAQGAAEKVLTKANERAEVAADYLGRKTEELGQSIRPKDKG